MKKYTKNSTKRNGREMRNSGQNEEQGECHDFESSGQSLLDKPTKVNLSVHCAVSHQNYHRPLYSIAIKLTLNIKWL
jgi:hypothetical protein